ncbi:glycosyltransferase family 2 protein [Vibrio breoganii]|uniref:glycosyltransferase family 2 protein n=1 Tax=Vibrio breoganii TaxID=553239 RepID=UPI0021C3AD0C|nr:glycosyltransferase [Vibrio breoganii]MDN3715956.1 glycosyltransferase [Vibrio breoganii]
MFTKLKAPNSEDEITKLWKHTDKVYVSVLCTSFNHELYIQDAIESFLAQETEYKFEIIIHDDASHDNSAEIIQRYHEKFPSIIKPIYQRENQFSEYPTKPLINCLMDSEGEYIAICEGDDFWVDNRKIQKQICSIDEFKEVDICFTSAFGLSPGNIATKLAEYGTQTKLFGVSEVIRSGGGFMPTPSLFIRRAVLVNLPDWFKEAKVGDFFIQILGSLKGGALYIPEQAVCYRIMAINSWTSKNTGIQLYYHRVNMKNTYCKLAYNYPQLVEPLKYISRKGDFQALLAFAKRGQIMLSVKMIYQMMNKKISIYKRG